MEANKEERDTIEIESNWRKIFNHNQVETKNPNFKGSYVMHGHRDQEKKSLVHQSATVNLSSVRLIIGLVSKFDFKIWKEYISQAYIQSKSELLRDVYLKPSKQLSITPEKIELESICLRA